MEGSPPPEKQRISKERLHRSVLRKVGFDTPKEDILRVSARETLLRARAKKGVRKLERYANNGNASGPLPPKEK